jgi:hypothetical protein
MLWLDWFQISEHHDLTWKIIQKSIRDDPAAFDWTGISKNPNVTLEIIQENPHLPWDWDIIIQQPYISQEYIEANYDKYDPLCIEQNPNLTIEFMLRHPELNWYGVWLNPNLTWETVAPYANKCSSWELLGKNKFGYVKKIIRY